MKNRISFVPPHLPTHQRNRNLWPLQLYLPPGDAIIHDLVHVFDELEDPNKRVEALARKYLQLAADQKTKEQKVLEQEKVSVIPRNLENLLRSCTISNKMKRI